MHDDFAPVRQKYESPGLTGRLNPILDNLDRMYLYATNVAIDDGRQQPVHFKLGEAMRLTDVHGSEGMVRFVEMTGNSSVLEYESPMPPGREGEQTGSGSFRRTPLTTTKSFTILTSLM